MNNVSTDLTHRALTQFSSAILTMQGGDDLERLVVALWAELSTLGLNMRYCGINILDEEAQQLSLYGVHEKGLLVAQQIPFGARLGVEGFPDFTYALELFKEGKPLRYPLKTSVLLQWLQKLRILGIPIKGPDPQVSYEISDVLQVPFKYGSIQLAREMETPFDEEALKIIQDFAQLLAFGYARYLDLIKLEEQNKELRVGLAADRMHAEVLAMKKSGDWGKVVSVMRKELLELGVKFTGCSINVIDEQAWLFRQHMILPSHIRKTFDPGHPFQVIDAETDLFILERPMESGKVPFPPAMKAWKNKTVLRRVVEGEERRRIAERSMQSMGFKISPLEVYPRLLLDIPFSQGLISLAAAAPGDLTEEDEAILQQMAQAISVAYARFLDMRELEQKNRELREAQAQLVQAAKLAAMGQLVAGVAHEINTPLGTINSNFDVTARVLGRIRAALPALKKERAEELSKLLDTVQPLLSLNRVACERIIHIVRDLKNFARLDEAEFKMANLNEDIETTLNLLQHELKDRIQVIKQFADLPPIPCYPNRLNQVFMNLLINACQSIQGKGQIKIATALVDHQVRISISDTGTGITKEHLDKIFDPGFTTKGVGVGTGLGLSISARIIQDHKGTIEVESEVGKGTTFAISLPVSISRHATENLM
ncbi:MAG: hypothetical protein DMG05_16035 [Acidobacteria bacterium]|nr:MAG: hypothetical protein DMG05_16035 [Acidobacteriota bacterium]